ncbi:sugar phosphate isomerase/epimerase [soil metagenome]
MSQFDRRSFFSRTALAALAGPFALARSAPAMDPIDRGRPSHLKLSIAAYSYRQLLSGENKSMDLFDFADLAADLKLDAIEPTSYYFPEDVDAADMHRLQRHAFLCGLDISGTAIRNDYCLPPGPEREQQFDHTRAWIDLAAELHAPVIRIFAGNVPRGSTEDEAVERAIEGIQTVLPYAEQRGVILALENHGGITATPKQMLRLIQAIDHPSFGVNFDSGNFRTEDPYADLAEIAPYAVNAQVKTEIQRGSEKEEADLSKIIEILRDAHYSGYVVLEYEAAEDPLKAIPRHVEKLRKIIGGT